MQAKEYFERAAAGPEPFVLALHAMGNVYADIDADKARRYYLRAARLGSPEGLFQLAVMSMKGEGKREPDVPRAVLFLAEAINRGHIRSMNFLAHALYDKESWLYTHSRDERAAQRFREHSRNFQKLQGGGSTENGTDNGTVGTTPHPQAKKAGAEGAEAEWDPWSDSAGGARDNIVIHLPDGSVHSIPFPLSSLEGSAAADCAALALLRFLVSHVFRNVSIS